MSNGAQQQQPARTSRPQKRGGNNTKNTQTFISFVFSFFLDDIVGGDFYLFFMEGSYPSHWNTDLYQWAPQAL
jgi:hypothetical protein